MNLTRPLVASGAAVLLALSLSACGGDNPEDAPKNASQEEFCDALADTDEGPGDDASAEEKLEFANERADELTELGTPEGMPEDARRGFETYLQGIRDLEESDVETIDEAESDEEVREAFGFSEDEFDDVTALFEYQATECADAGSGSDDGTTE